jgi:hypothetical protein
VPPRGEKPCRICDHLERSLIDELLLQGFAPRALVKRIGQTTRKNLAYHRDRCLSEEKKGGG